MSTLGMVNQTLYGTNRRDPARKLENLIGKNLSRIDLSGANLRRIDLRSADLSQSNLNSTDLREANLAKARLNSSSLSNADLRKANLEKTDLRKANLFKANLRNASLYKADLRNADLSDADLGGANLRQADLRKANFFKANLSRVELSGADLSGTNLARAILCNLDLSGAELSEANLIGADLSRTDASGADLSGTVLRYAILNTTDLRCSNLRGADFTGADLIQSNLFGADLREADLSDANLKRTNLGKADIRGTFLGEGIGLSAQNIQDYRDRGAIFENSIVLYNRKTFSFVYSPSFTEDFRNKNIRDNNQHTTSDFHLDIVAVRVKQAESAKVNSLLSTIFEEDSIVSIVAKSETRIFDNNETFTSGLDKLHTRFLGILAQQHSWNRAALESKAAELNLLLDGALEVINDTAFDVCDEPLTDGEDPINLDTDVLEQLLP
ncbi:MAG: hypothetical protein DCF15_01435 [Phormidesmis priestleyi]|uniref:TerB-C domain-containing protein n=1 Tax=Phormidesmis priestleyi TaxID=268141 RepID=A0A2W4ZQF0_9CYAN|nr:MAG: hypothetical protein DCF15_01435 [Phormidesmis priestleyi]